MRCHNGSNLKQLWFDNEFTGTFDSQLFCHHTALAGVPLAEQKLPPACYRNHQMQMIELLQELTPHTR